MGIKKSNFQFSPYYGIVALIVFLTLAVYSQVAGHDFIGYDDSVNLLANPYIQSGLNFQNIKWAFTNLFDGNYIPLNWISHMAAMEIFGHRAGGHLLINVFLHILNTLLLLMLLTKTTGKKWPSLLVAALFALHPLHVESVAWVSARKDVLSGMFWLLTCLAYYDWIQGPNLRRYMTAVIFFALGLLTKPMLMTLPVILLLFDYWPLRRFEKLMPQELIKEKAAFFALAFISACLTLVAHETKGWINDAAVISFDFRFANAMLSYVKYLQKMIWPLDLSVFYPYESIKPLLIKGMLSIGFLFLVTFAVIRQMKNRPALFVGWFFYLIMLFPVIGIISFAGFSMADRFTYLPLIGIFMMVGWESPHAFQRLKLHPVILRVCLTAVVFVCTVISFFQIGYWKNTETLFSHAYQVTKNNFIAHIQLGSYYTHLGELDLAASHYEMAVVIRPDPDTLNNLGNTYYLLGRKNEAMRTYERVVADYPMHVIGWANMGLMAKEKSDYANAGKYYAEAIRLEPNYLPAYGPLAEILIQEGRKEEATSLLNRALQKNPNDVNLKHWLRMAQG